MLISFYPPPMPGLGRDEPGSASAYLRRQWIRGAWRQSSWRARLGFVMAILAWWPVTILQATYLAVRLGPSRRRLSGKSPLRQFIEQIEVAAKWTMPPPWYYTFEFFDDARRARAGDYLQRVQVKSFIYGWLVDRKQRKYPRLPFANKLYFSNICREHGLRAGSTIAVATRKYINFLEPGLTALPARDLFVKTKAGRGGRGAEKWIYSGGAYHDAEGRRLTAPALARHLQRRARFEKRLVEYCLSNHRDLADLNLGALATVRILTARNESGDIEATHAVFRMPQRPRAPVDNIHAGGIAAPVDLATGRLGRATDLGLKPTSRWHDRHPVTQAPIVGRTLPHWPAALELARRAHARIGDRIVVGWDVALLEDGPCLVEGNGRPDVDLIQRPHRIGLGASRLGEILAFHLKNHMAGDVRNGRRLEELAEA